MQALINNRRHQRTPIKCQVRIWHESIGEKTVVTRDISNGGLFLVMDGQEALIPEVGVVIQGQLQGMMQDAPIVSMEVVRIEPAGIGLQFLADEN